MDRYLAITTVVGCRNQCVYCPQDKFVRAYLKRSKVSSMSFETFKTCIDKLPKDVKINFAGFSEPWLNPDCTKMVLYAHQRGYGVSIFTTAVGMTLSDIEQIKDIPFEVFAVHLPDDDLSTKINVDDHYLSVLEGLHKSGIKNLRFTINVDHNNPAGVHSLIKAFMEEKGIPLVKETMVTRANNITIEGVESPNHISGKLAWCWRLRVNILLPNGDIALCCMDWSLKHILGNLLTSSYESLFESEQFKKVTSGLTDESIDILCRSCDWATKKKTAIATLRDYIKRKINTWITLANSP